MKKSCDLHIRISENDLQLLKSVSLKYQMSLTDFILSILIPYCLKNNK